MVFSRVVPVLLSVSMLLMVEAFGPGISTGTAYAGDRKVQKLIIQSDEDEGRAYTSQLLERGRSYTARPQGRSYTAAPRNTGDDLSSNGTNARGRIGKIARFFGL